MTEFELTPKDVSVHLSQFITNAEEQIRRGKRPSALCLEGAAGIAKTSLIKQIAEKHNYKIHQINTAMIDDLGILVGFPQREFKFRLQDNVSWIPSELTDSYIAQGGIYEGESRMSYAVPDWLKTIEPNEKFILLLDDFTRAMPTVMQASMTIVDEYKYASWVLPKNTIILLTTNPDDGQYNVTSLDIAQRTRFRYIKMKFSVDDWAAWAESDDLDSRCINFVISHPEVFKQDEGIGFGNKLNARSMTKFFYDIGALPDFSTKLAYVQEAGMGSVGEGFTRLFITFINNKLDKLPSPSDLFKGTLDEAIRKIKEVTGDHTQAGNYNPARASIISTRITNYVIYGNHDKWTRTENERVVGLILSPVFSQDLKFAMAKKFKSSDAAAASSKLQMIMQHPEIIKMIIK